MTEITVPDPLAAARRERFRPFLVLVAGFVVVSAAMELVIVAQSVLGTAVDGAVWWRSSAVLVSSIVLLLLMIDAAKGSASSFRRVRIVSPIIVLAVVVIVCIPDFLPLWARIEQGFCGGLVVPVAILANLTRTRALFPTRA